tara:strand:- start:3279 stop:3959 length:681 start_codon:yes stop_codon:yes gene_type:complete
MAKFWRNATAEPKRAYRWFITFGGLGTNTSGGNAGASDNPAVATTDLTYAVKRVDKPSISISETEHTFINHKFYYPGRVDWSDVSVSFVDVVGAGSATDSVLVALAAAGYDVPSNASAPASNTDTAGAANFTTVSKHSMSTALGSVIITQVNSEGIPVETWTLNNPWIKSINVGSLDYGSEELLSVDISLRYDWATFARPSGAKGVAPDDTDTPDAGGGELFTLWE